MPNKYEYNKLKKLGICVYCQKAKAVKGKTMCLDCLDKVKIEGEWARSEASKTQRRLYIKRKREICIAFGVCRECFCRDATHGLKCYRCYSKGKAKYKSKRELYKACGLCVLCGGARVDGYKVCNRCLDKCRDIVKNRKRIDNNNHFWRKIQSGEVKLVETLYKRRCGEVDV